MSIATKPPKGNLQRTTFATSRLLEFCSEKELTTQTGHDPSEWPLVIVKELVDNALDACEEAGVAPSIKIVVGPHGITVSDDGPGMPAGTIERLLNYSMKVSSREAYVAPDRGAQGNALQTIFAMPFVVDGNEGRVDVLSRGQCHEIRFTVDQIRRKPTISHAARPVENVKIGTTTRVFWASPLGEVGPRFLQQASDFSCLNPHLSLSVSWFGGTSGGVRGVDKATARDWRRWVPNRPTSPHWYGLSDFERLVSAYIAHDQDLGEDRSVRELVKEFNGLTGTAKQRAVLEATGLARTNLSSLVNCHGLRHDVTTALLDAMKAASRPIKPAALGVIGQEHIEKRFADLGA